MSEHYETICWVETKQISIKIDLLTKDQITDLGLMCRKAISNKISKLNVILKELDVYVRDGQILVSDKYGVAPTDFIEIVEAFGMNIKQIQSNLKGKAYIIGDELIELTKILGDSSLELGISNSTLTKEIEKLINDNKFTFDNIKEQYSKKITEIIKIINSKGEYSISEYRTIEHTQTIGVKANMGVISTRVVEDSKRTISVRSSEDKVKETINNFFKQINSKITETNNNLRDGTIQILYSRARKMGYNVEKVKKGNLVQLVLVRND
jgi:hypothetical protein